MRDEQINQMQRAMQDMQVSLSERDAEIIRLNLCLGDQKRAAEMPMQQMTPTRMSRSSSRQQMYPT